MDGLISVLVGNAGISAVVGSRVWSKVAPQRAALPHIIVHRMSEEHNLTLTDTGGLVFADFDVDCKAATAKGATDLAALVQAFIDDYTGAMGTVTCQAVLLNDVSDDYEEPRHGDELGRHITTLEVQIQYST